MIWKTNPIEALQFPGLSEYDNVFHFITTRQKGEETGPYATFNLGEYSGDDPNIVRLNRQRLCEAFSISADRLFVPHQVHGSSIRIVDEDVLLLPSDRQKEALDGVDALVTSVKGVCIAVTTADCVPIVMYAPDKEVAAVVHAGWRGLVGHIIEKTVDCLIHQFNCDPSEICAGIGPSISQRAFEVGEEVVDDFAASGIDVSVITVRHKITGRSHLDLWHAACMALEISGLQTHHIETADICTYTHADQFFSARRHGLYSGRFLSGIMLT